MKRRLGDRGAADGAWFHVVETEADRPADARLAPDGRWLSRRPHGYEARLSIEDRSGDDLPVASWLRAAAAAGRALERTGDGCDRPVTVVLGPAGTHARIEQEDGAERLHLDGPELSAAASRHRVEAQALELLSPGAGTRSNAAADPIEPVGGRVLFFESLMSSDMPHNDREISQGVLHMVSALSGDEGTPRSEPLLLNVKMPSSGSKEPPSGLAELGELLDRTTVQLVCITLLEDYFDGARELIACLRAHGCRAHVAVGGVMPSLTPEHVAAHLDEVTFVCRGAGEYFVPRLARIVGHGDRDTPFSDPQCRALMAMDGLLAIDRAGRRLIAGNPGRTVRVGDLGAIELDLSYVEPRHIEGGIEISTARGCMHHCTFCSILGRGSYQARAADRVIQLLECYQERFAELFGANVPQNAFRVHISDDDFACDRERAAEILGRLGDTPFRLSSVQVSVADLCLRDGSHLLAEIDPLLVDAFTPSLFADNARDIPEAELIDDYHPRRWSSYLQIGVETFCDRELIRLAKGYRVEHIRAVVSALSARGLHMDAYFIFANSDTSADDLVDSLEEACRLKLRHPRFFHLRYPAVPHLVSYFPSVSHRHKVSQGRAHTMALRRLAQVPNHPELDYPFVERDIPGDSWVGAITNNDVLSSAGCYSDSLTRLAERWRQRLSDLDPGPERQRGEQLVRRLDDAPRRLVFEMLAEVVERGRSGDRPGEIDDAGALATATSVLGPREGWLEAFRRYCHQERPRLVVIPTWQCELRCRYCYIPKQEGRVMSRRTLERSVDMLLESDRRKLMLQFFGGEPLVEYELVRHGIDYASREAARRGKAVSFIVSSNGWSLDEERLAWLARHPVKLELSLDGDPETQNRYRHAHRSEADSYQMGIATRVEAIHASGLDYDVIMVVHPDNVAKMPHNFFHIADLGFRRIQINFGLGATWSEEHKKSFADGLFQIGRELRQRWASGQALTMVNIENKPMPVRLNAEITVDHDGTIYGGNGFLHETAHKDRFVIGQLDDLGSFDRYWLDMPSNDFLLEWTYPPDITRNNVEVGRIMNSFVRWMRKESAGQGSSPLSSVAPHQE